MWWNNQTLFYVWSNLQFGQRLNKFKRYYALKHLANTEDFKSNAIYIGGRIPYYSIVVIIYSPLKVYVNC